MDILDVLFWVSESLEKQEIPYMLSGSLAMNTYTLPRMTRDIDIVVSLKETDIEKLISILGSDFYWHEPSIREEIRRKGMFNAIHHASGVKVDFMVLKENPFRQIEFGRRRKIQFLGKEVFIVSLEDLIISKLVWIQESQSEMQMKDIRNLLTNKNIDQAYLSHWFSELSLKTFDLL